MRRVVLLVGVLALLLAPVPSAKAFWPFGGKRGGTAATGPACHLLQGNGVQLQGNSVNLCVAT